MKGLTLKSHLPQSAATQRSRNQLPTSGSRPSLLPRSEKSGTYGKRKGPLQDLLERARLSNEKSGEIEPVEVHDLGPGRHEVAHEFLLGVAAAIDFRERTELRVRSEEQIDARGGPF